jgi:hypothetical protein
MLVGKMREFFRSVAPALAVPRFLQRVVDAVRRSADNYDWGRMWAGAGSEGRKSIRLRNALPEMQLSDYCPESDRLAS